MDPGPRLNRHTQCSNRNECWCNDRTSFAIVISPPGIYRVAFVGVYRISRRSFSHVGLEMGTDTNSDTIIGTNTDTSTGNGTGTNADTTFERPAVMNDRRLDTSGASPLVQRSVPNSASTSSYLLERPVATTNGQFDSPATLLGYIPSCGGARNARLIPMPSRATDDDEQLANCYHINTVVR